MPNVSDHHGPVERAGGPLASLKVLDFSHLLPGPYATMLLADLGADVLRVESPHRPDMMRFLPPLEDGVSGWHSTLNRSKRSIALDLRQPEAVEIVKDLVRRYDIVLEQFRPGVMARLGIGYEALSAANPQLIYCALTGYGQTGPYRDRAGHDINYLALSGVMSHTGKKESGPVPLGVQVADLGGAFTAVTGILAAVIHRQQSGQGQLVDVSMFDASIAWQAPLASHYLVGGEDVEWESWLLNGGSYYGFYRTADGRYLAVGSLEPRFWQGFCAAIGRADLVEAGQEWSDPACQQRVRAEVAQVFASRSFAEWVSLFAGLDVCVEPVLTLAEMAAHPQTQARRMIVDVPRGDGTAQRQVGSPLKFSRTRPAYRHTGAALGEHTNDVLADLGYSEAQIERLRAAGVFG